MRAIILSNFRIAYNVNVFVQISFFKQSDDNLIPTVVMEIPQQVTLSNGTYELKALRLSYFSKVAQLTVKSFTSEYIF